MNDNEIIQLVQKQLLNLQQQIELMHDRIKLLELQIKAQEVRVQNAENCIIENIPPSHPS